MHRDSTKIHMKLQVKCSPIKIEKWPSQNFNTDQYLSVLWEIAARVVLVPHAQRLAVSPGRHNHTLLALLTIQSHMQSFQVR